ncbi:MAG TPA: family 1 glycosylhydrolase [Myxococcales bacterium]|nr:family 1 glycosylhydrolase [Myxococcales bacterium]
MGPRLEFPRGFFWGTSTSSHQVEGNNDNNDWSEWEKRPGAITDGTRAGAACGWWDGRAEQDLAAAATAGQNAHRLSLEWSRLEPEPGRWDNAAFGRYARLLEEMRHLGLRAMVTLQHVTLPLWLARRGAWTSWEAVDAFARYAEECARRLDGRVDSWVTMNEPAAVAGAAYALTYWPPGLGSSRAALRALAVMLEAHAAGYQAVKRVAPRAAVGIVLSAPRLEPARRTLSDRGITWVQDWAFLASTLFALRTGILPLPLRGRRARVPGLRGATDFLGVNYYGRYAVRFDPHNAALLFGRHVQEPTVRTGRCDWGAIAPEGLTRQLLRLSRFGVPLYVTENGIRDEEDSTRQDYLRSHVAAVHEAIRLGVEVRGYFHWSLLDNFEWAEGWAPRFGLSALDPATQRRTPRPSAALYAEICRTNSVEA